MSMDFLKTVRIASGGLRVQSGRMRVIAENLANVHSTAQTPQGDPYRRKIPTFKSQFDREIGAQTVDLGRTVTDKSDFQTRYEPHHPMADGNGYVKYPNVNSIIETMDMKEAQRAYEANLNIVTATRRMIQRTLEIMKG